MQMLPRTPECTLTPREEEVLYWTAQGKTSWEISNIISRSTATVNFYTQRIIGKLDAVNKYHATIKAFQLGWLPRAPETIARPHQETNHGSEV
jgi:DNA-binding CsgD family transcriptional regulator